MIMINILELAASGLDIEDIARTAGVTPEKAVQVINQQLASQLKLSTEEARLVEVKHLDMIRAALTPAALRGDLDAARLLVRISQAKTLLLHLAIDAPTEEDQEGEDDLDRIRNSRTARIQAKD